MHQSLEKNPSLPSWDYRCQNQNLDQGNYGTDLRRLAQIIKHEVDFSIFAVIVITSN